MWPFKRKADPIETRSSGTGYTSAIMAARESYLRSGGVAELTATVQTCVSLWESGLLSADVEGTRFLNRRVLAHMARALALRGESVHLISENGLVPCSDWDVATRNGEPRAYRLSISEAGGGRRETALAAEVLHLRIGSDNAAPWSGSAPLKRAQLSASLLNTLETALCEVYTDGAIGTSVLPYPEAPETDLDDLARKFRGARGKIVIRESVNVASAGGPAPMLDWKPSDLTPDIEKSLAIEALREAKNAILMTYGVLPALLNPNTTGPLVREAERFLANWILQPIADLISEEACEKLGAPVKVDAMVRMQAFDAGARSRALHTIIDGLARAKEAGVDPDKAFKLLDWEEK